MSEKSSDSSFDSKGFSLRLNSLITQTNTSQAQFARSVGVSPGFLSDLVNGRKRPGLEFLLGIHHVLGTSIDWLLTGEGTMVVRNGIDIKELRDIELYIAIAKAAVVNNDPIAKSLVLLIQSDQLQTAINSPDVQQFLETITLDTDLALAIELYNGHLCYEDDSSKRRNLFASAKAHFEMQTPHDKKASIAATSTTVHQIIKGKNNRVAGRDYIEKK